MKLSASTWTGGARRLPSAHAQSCPAAEHPRRRHQAFITGTFSTSHRPADPCATPRLRGARALHTVQRAVHRRTSRKPRLPCTHTGHGHQVSADEAPKVSRPGLRDPHPSLRPSCSSNLNHARCTPPGHPGRREEGSHWDRTDISLLPLRGLRVFMAQNPPSFPASVPALPPCTLPRAEA